MEFIALTNRQKLEMIFVSESDGDSTIQDACEDF